MAMRETGFRKIGDEAVKARTGRGWEDWHTILDTWGASERGHTRRAKRLLEQYGLSSWWAQAVIIRYERQRGLREQ
jgi:hypothetical protein